MGKKKTCCILTPCSGSGNRMEDTPLKQLFFSSLYLFDSIFFGIVWIDKLNNYVKGVYFNVKETGKRFLAMVAKTKKCFINNKKKNLATSKK